MTDLNEKLKLVAEYLSGRISMAWSVNGVDTNAWYGGDVREWRKKFKMPTANCILIEHCEFHTSYDWQIPVWQNVCKEFLDMKNQYTDDIRQFMLFKEKYCKHICYNTPLESFEILVQAIQFINNLKQN